MARDGSERAADTDSAAATGKSPRSQELGDRLEQIEAERRQAEEESDQVAEASALRRMGDLQRAAGLGDEARESYSRARYLYQLTGNSEGAANLLLTLGNMEARQSRAETAAGYFHDARDLFQRLVAPEKEADAALSEGDALYAMGDGEGALGCYQAAGDLFANLDDTLGQAHTAFRLAVLSSAEDPEAAGEQYGLAASLFAEHVPAEADGGQAPLPNRVTDSRRYPPVLMQKICVRERTLITGEQGEVEAPAPAAPSRKAERAARPGPAVAPAPPTPRGGHDTSWTMWIGIGLLLAGALVLFLPKMFSGSTLIPSIVEALSKLVSLGVVLQVTLGVLGAVVAILGARQIGISAPVILLALGIGIGAIFHEVGRSLVAALDINSATQEPQANPAEIELAAVKVTRSAAVKWLQDARAAIERSDFDAARKAFEESYTLSQHSKDKVNRLRVLEELLVLEEKHGRIGDRLLVTERLYDEVRGKDRERERELLEQIVALASRSDDAAKLRKAHLKLLEYHADDGNKEGEVTTLLALAAIDRDNRKLADAFDWYEQAHNTYQSMQDTQGQVGTLLAMGEIDARLGRRRRAYGSYYHAFAMYREIGDVAGQAAALLHMGTLDEASERYEEAAAAFRQSKRLYASVGDRDGEALAALRYAAVQSAHGNQRQARNAFRRSLQIYQESRDAAGQAHAHLGLGHLARRQGKRDKAEEHYRQAEDLYRRADDPGGQMAALRERALLAHESGRESVAQAQLAEVSRVAKNAADPQVRARLLISVGDLAVSLKRSESAAETYRQALALYEDIGDDDGRRVAGEKLRRLRAAS